MKRGPEAMNSKQHAMKVLVARGGEKALVTALARLREDFRDWDEIRAWASEIADALRVETSA